jgi:hypothetical protein
LKKRKFYPTAALLFGFIAVMTAVDLASPVRSFSELENRSLKTSAKFSFEKLWSGEFQSRYEDVVTDQFAGRDGWITLKSLTESALLKTENNGVLYGKNGALFGKLTGYDREQLEKNIGFVEEFAEEVGGVTFGIIPSGYTYSPDQLPLGAGQVDQREVLSGLTYGEAMQLLDADGILRAMDSESLYYNTDHHWRGTTVYAFYRAFCEQMGYTAFNGEQLTLREIDGFYGTYYSKCKKAGTEPDTLTYYDLPFAVKTTVDGEEKDGWYDASAFDKRDKYAAFLYGNGGLTVLSRETVPENPKRLLLIKDSYSNALAPLFLSAFDEVYVVDLRSYPTGIHALAEEKNFDEILVLYNFENLQSDTNFYRLRY